MADSVKEKVHAFFSQYPKRSYAKGQILVFADEDPEHIFYMVEGRVRTYDISYRGDEIIVTIYKPPAFFPMSGLLTGAPNKYFYKTETPTEVHLVPPEDALKFVKDNPDVAFDLLSRLYSGVDGLLGRLVHLMSGSAKSRILYELLIECRRFGKKLADGSYQLDITEVDLAAHCGLSRETVSREIRQLKEKDLLEIGNKHIVVKDAVRLKQRADSEI